jgi:hypothetical protein
MRHRFLPFAVVFGLSACTPPSPQNTGVYILIDTSGSYNSHIRRAEQVVLYALSRLQSGDTIAVARIGTGSFTENDIIAEATLDDRPSTADLQKRAFAKRVENFLDHSKPTPYTDITGGLLQAVEFLNEKHTERKEILIFSDMEQDLAKGYVRNIPLDLKGVDVVALNVVKHRSDNLDPRRYFGRLDKWRSRVDKDGGHWQVINELDDLHGLF